MDFHSLKRVAGEEIRSFRRLPRYMFRKLGLRRSRKRRDVIMIVEGGDWVISRISEYMKANINSDAIRFSADTRSRYYCDSIVHFGSLNTFVGGNRKSLDGTNRAVLSLYHGDFGINKRMDNSLSEVLTHHECLDTVVVSTSIMRERLLKWGIPSAKIELIPIGIDCDSFVPMKNMAPQLRRELGIPDDACCIGSFQKDGNGWGEGLEPKLIKGPDIFVDVVKELSRRRKVHCLLTGPARGYVKNALGAANISFTHRELPNYRDIVPYYNCLDLYLVTSREEGGPQAILESMATGTPVVSTRVGMAPDVIISGENGIVAEVGDVDGIVLAAETILGDPNLRDRIIANGMSTIHEYSWQKVCSKYKAIYDRLED